MLIFFRLAIILTLIYLIARHVVYPLVRCALAPTLSKILNNRKMSLDEKIVLLKEKKEKLENLKIEAQLQEDILKLDKEYEKVNERLIEIENEKFEELKERHSSLFENKNNKIKM